MSFRDEDDAYEYFRQREIDDPIAVESKRRASGYSPEELFLEQVMTEGMTAGLMGRAASENPYQSEHPEHLEWERCRKIAAASKVAGMVA